MESDTANTCWLQKQAGHCCEGWSRCRQGSAMHEGREQTSLPISPTPHPYLLPWRLCPQGAEHLCFFTLLLSLTHHRTEVKECRTHLSIISLLSWHSWEPSQLILNASLQVLLKLKGKRSHGLVGRWTEKLGALSSLNLPVKGWSMNSQNAFFLAMKPLYPGKQATHLLSCLTASTCYKLRTEKWGLQMPKHIGAGYSLTCDFQTGGIYSSTRWLTGGATELPTNTLPP